MAQVHSGARSARMGLLSGMVSISSQPDVRERNVLGKVAPLGASYSSGYQTVRIPADPKNATLTFWYRPGSEATRGDFQRSRLLKDDYSYLVTVMKVLENSTEWRWWVFDLTPYRGRSIVIY